MEGIRPKNSKIIKGKTLIVAVDLGKSMNVGYCRHPNGKELKPFSFFNDGRGFEEFWRKVLQFGKDGSVEEIAVGLESIGPYGEPLVHYLRKRGAKVVQVNPMHTKRLKELQGNSPNKTDQKDPKVIADIMELGHSLSVIVPEGVAAQLRRLMYAREREMERRRSLLNQLHDLVFVSFPEFLRVMKGVDSKSAQYLLEHYPLPGDLLRVDVATLASAMKEVSRGRLDKGRAEALYQVARETVGISEGLEGIKIEMKHLLELTKGSDQFLTEIEEKMSDYLALIPYSKFIRSIKGVGCLTAAGYTAPH